MTDFEKVKQFLDEMGIGYESIEKCQRLTDDEMAFEPCIGIVLEEGMQKVTGYSGFIIRFEFTLDGKLIEVGACE